MASDPSIGGQTFLWMRGAIPYSVDILENLDRIGNVGVVYRLVGHRSEPATIYTRTLCYTYGAVDDAMFAYASMQGWPWTLVDELGIIRPRVMVVMYRPVRFFRTYAGSTVPNGVYAVLDSEWTLQDLMVCWDEA